MEEDVKVNPPWPPSRNWIWLVVVGIIAVAVLFSSFYTVGPDEVGVIKRFGKYMRTTDPGLHAKIPFVESATKVKVKRVFKEEFGFRTVQAGVKTLYAPEEYQDESLMLTGDLNVAVVEWIVQYRIIDPYKYLFKVKDVRKTIRDISEVVMRLIVGDRSVDEILTVGRAEAAAKAQEKLQQILDSYDTGVKVVTLKLKDVNPPEPVKPAFNEVNEARQDRERFINEAWQAYNKVIPEAKGKAKKMVSEAEGYATRRVNRAEGDSNRFLALWQEYRKAPDVTRKRLYLESFAEILPRVGKIYVVDSEQKSLLPLLPLQGREVPLQGGGK